MSMATSTSSPSVNANSLIDRPVATFDQILAHSRSRSRSGSANSASLVASLPPPPRRKKPPTPESLATGSATSLPMQRHNISTSETQFPQISAGSSPFRNPSALTDTESLRRQPQAFGLYNGGDQQAQHKYADSLSSLSSYSNLFYKPGDEARKTPTPIIRHYDDQSSDHASLDDDDISVADYSALLYPELQAGNGPPRSPQPSLDVHGPPMRKRTPSFASEDGPESPVEFANLGVASLPPPPPPVATDEHRPSKIDRLLGLDSEPSKRRESAERLIPELGRRDSFMEFDVVASRPGPAAIDAQLRSQSSVSGDMPTFSLRNKRSILLNTTLSGYKALVEAVEHKETLPDGSPKLDSRQILVDGSDIPKPAARSPPANHESNRSSTASSSLEPRLSTSNFLDKQERADAVRKNRKIAQVLGPGVLPAAQALTRVGRTTPTQDTPDSHRNAAFRPVRSHSLALDDARSDAIFKMQARTKPAHRPPNLNAKSSWTALEHDTIYLTSNGRRHSSPMNPTFDPSITRRIDSDVASLSSLGSIITGEGRIVRSKDPARPGSPSSFMEMSDDEGATTPKRRPSIESTRPLPQSLRSPSRTASLNDIVTVSSALESPRRTSAPNTPFSVSSSVSASRGQLDEDPTFEEDFRSQRDSWSNYSFNDAESAEMRLERQRKRERLAKIHRYLGSKVPPELVLGYSSSTNLSSSSPLRVEVEVVVQKDEQEVKKRRRSSSAVLYQQTHKIDLPRNKEAESRNKDTLTDAEKLKLIKRTQKIEQIFGESPSRPRSLSIPRPSSAQGLMHQPPAPTNPLNRTTVATYIPEHSTTERGFKPRSPFIWKEGRPSTAGSSRPSTTQSTSGLISSYQKDVEKERKSRAKKQSVDTSQVDTGQVIDISPYFPVGTALGSPWEDVYADQVLDISPQAMATYSSKSPVLPGVPTSRQFLDYRNSLNSLSRILDQVKTFFHRTYELSTENKIMNGHLIRTTGSR
ncbi:hypothetical protein M408DRAFT_191257 [Serendipita vermifera MAFF 305830]|uniref:Uncharacterized protein n=1 Tax=Serendipita vermifera MAFF 305830 TaxID=933852 RepID=A0A0C2X4J8_SERVB|nr:hypothetical protein M408DRAFT_191257 [Serendipita vermifera MAFF 305830]